MLGKRTLLATASLAFALGMATSATAAESFKIGAIMPLTGALQAYGETSAKGAQLAAKEINAAGGVLGQPLEIKIGDAQTLPQAGVDVANKLVNVDGVTAFVGALGSGVTIAVNQSVGKDNKIPQISPASTSPEITTLDDGDYLFRTTPSDAFQGVAMAQVATDRGGEDYAVIYVNNDYGKGLADAFKEAYEKAGGKVTAMTAYEEKQSSYRSDLKKIYGKGETQNLMMVAYVSDGETILRQSLEGGMFDSFLLSDGMKSADIIKNLGAENIEGAVGTASQAEEGSEAAQRFTKAYNEEYGENPPEPYIDNTYDAVYLLALAAEKAGSTDGTAIRDALRDVANPPGEEILPGDWAKAVELIAAGKDINWTGAIGNEDFDENGDISGTYAEYEYKDGEIVINRIFDPAAEAEEAEE